MCGVLVEIFPRGLPQIPPPRIPGEETVGTGKGCIHNFRNEKRVFNYHNGKFRFTPGEILRLGTGKRPGNYGKMDGLGREAN